MKHKKLIIVSAVVLALTIAGLATAGYFGVRQYKAFQVQNQIKEQQAQQLIEKQEQALELAQLEISKLKQETEESKEKQTELEQAIKSVPKPVEQKSLDSIIKPWRPRIAYIVCYFGSGSSSSQISGSGLLMDGWIATNDHVLRYEGKTPTACTAKLPDGNVTYYADVANSIAYGDDIDIAAITIGNKDSYLSTLSLKPINFCERKAEIGESVVILGYPYTGSSYDITATEGIISGYDGYYYITSAKIEQGNSGGVAVLLKDNCYLGIPSSVAAGQLESLGRILDARIMDDENYFTKYPNGI